MSDPTKRPLHFPHWQIPFLEKHRIFELFHEITRELVIQKPADHVLFTKQILLNAAKSRDVARVIIIKSPKINCLEVANCIAKITRQVVISERSLTNCTGTEMSFISSQTLAKCLAYLVRTENAYNVGWIIVNCIRTEEDAKELIQLGILPTHVIHLIAPFHPDLSQLLYCNVQPEWPEYRRNIFALRNVYKRVLKEVYLGEKNLTDIVHECVELSKIRKALKPICPRVVLLGPRGSGRKTQAKLLEANMKLIHVDFEYIICQAWMAENELGEKLRACRTEVCFHSELLSQVVNKRILEDDCINNGWVLTGYPYTDIDFKFLDSLDTPPNRVIFLECDLNVCQERLRYRQMNVYTGSITNVKDTSVAKPELKTHPRDNMDLIEAELNYYCQNYGLLRKYCGETASIVNGDQNERWVYECITAILLRSLPPAPPRKGCTDIASSRSSSDYDCDCISIPSKVLGCYITKI